jgi:hypothetical protein
LNDERIKGEATVTFCPETTAEVEGAVVVAELMLEVVERGVLAVLGVRVEEEGLLEVEGRVVVI